MSTKLITNGIVIDPNRHLLQFGDEIVQVRPRTFALLLVLLQQPLQVLSKQYLLETVWDDVLADEQVLFQTIRELRQLLRDPDLIKTYPRKGYAWTAAVENSMLEPPDAPTEVAPVFRSQRATRRLLYVLVPLLCLALLTIHFVREFQAPLTEGPILVLPVKNNVPGSDHHWVYLGAMDQLIGMLQSDGTTLAMETEYVLDTMRRAALSRNFVSEDVARIFVISGAAVVVETSLSGSIEEYRLDYRLHFSNDVKRGTLFGATVAELVRDLAQIITRHPLQGEPSGPAEFNNELMSRALERKDAGDLEAAASLFASVKELEADNLAARRLLAQVLISQGKHELAAAELETALTLTDAATEEKPRLGFWLAIAQAKQQEPERALHTLAVAAAEAAQHRNYLYLAYIAQLRGDLEQALGHFDRAKASLDEAILHHGIIRCPLGEALTRRQLAKLFHVQGALELAEREQALVRKLVQTHELPALETL